MNTDLARLPTWLLLAAFAAGAALHVDRAPMWCTIVAAGTLLWRWQHLQGRAPLPGTLLRIALACTLLVAVLLSFRTLGGLAAGSALLIVMGAAKLLETRTRRDAVVVAMVALVLVLAATLDRQNLLRVPLYLATGWLALATLAALGSQATAESARRAFASSGGALLLALPLALLCFVFVPRLPSAFWSAPGSGAATTGLSDEMSPGSISELALSDAIAFRVRFDGMVPPPEARYWRGPVLHDFDGYTWRRRPGQAAVPERAEPVSAPVRYQVMLEPHGRNELFGLDTITAIEGRRAMRTFDGQVISFRPVNTAITYDGVSHLQVSFPAALSITGRRLDTMLPPGSNPRSIALARSLRAQSSSDADYADRVLAHFRALGLQYTLAPPLLERDSVDDLLFRTRLGFCGHFASAYAMLMRAAGVPARVVTGYQGGAWNPIGGYYTVRQSEAHAWTEVWLEGRGWVRIDPTAVVAPDRLQRGLNELLGGGARSGDGLLGAGDWVHTLRDVWDATGAWWQERIVQFNHAAQQDLLSRLGLGNLDYRGLTMLLLAGAALWGIAIALWLARQGSRAPQDRLGREWHRFLALLERRGLQVAAHEGPESVRLRARRALPEAAHDIDSFARDYARLRFGPAALPTQDAQLRTFRQRLRRIARATATHRRARTAPAARE